MKVAIFALAVLALVHFSGADKIKCYQCPNVLQTCFAKDASEVICSEKSSCGRQVKKTGEDKLKAIRKCVITDSINPHGSCDSAQYECNSCTTDLCNSSHTVKINYFSVASLVLASVLFLNH